MIKVTLPGAIVTIILFIAVAAFLASQIQVGGSSIVIPGFPQETHPVSLLQLILSWLADSIPWPW